jgi:copper chaperone CopZ
MERVDSYGVRGLTCARCLVAAIEGLRALPGVDQVGVDLVPFGESRITVGPASSASKAAVQATLARAGFLLIGRRGSRPRPGLDDFRSSSFAPAS